MNKQVVNYLGKNTDLKQTRNLFGIEEVVKLLDGFGRERMVAIVGRLKDYSRESHAILGHDERSAEELVDLFLQEEETN